MEKVPSIHFEDFKSLLVARPRDAHKGMFGHVLVVGGHPGFLGAVRLAGEGALRVGAGLVSIASEASTASAIVAACPELMVHTIEQVSDLAPLLSKATCIVVGPGLSQGPRTQSFLHYLLKASLPKVLDADALNLLAVVPQRSDHWVLTPHVGEAARLLNSTVAEIQADRLAAARQLQLQYGGVIVLKGAGTLVCTANSLRICEAGNPGMASGGMGDVLSGIIGGFLAQGTTLQQAAELGVLVHAQAGDLAAKAGGERGLLASDLLPYVRAQVNTLN